MTTAVSAVFRDGVLHPATPFSLPEGTTVQLTVETTSPDIPAPDPATVLARILAIQAKFNPETDRPEVTSQNVDEVLYGCPDDAR